MPLQLSCAISLIWSIQLSSLLLIINGASFSPSFITTPCNSLIKQQYCVSMWSNNSRYDGYRQLSHKVKKERIFKAKQSQQFRKPNPQGTCQFPEYSFIDFHVTEKNKKIKLETYRFAAEGEARAIIFMFHGLNSHMGHGAHLAHYFSQQGFTTVGFDYRGFGRSEGREGHVESLKDHLADCKQFIKLVCPMYQKLPKFGLGLSMGGMTVYYLTLQDPNLFHGAILMAPALKNMIGGIFVKLAGFLGTILPSKTRLTKPVYGKASKNPSISQFVKQDPHAYSERMCLSTVDMIVKTMEESPKTFKDYKCPFIVIQGGTDKLVNPDVAFQLYDNSQTKQQDKEIIFYEDMWHDVWHEEQIWEIMPLVAQWIRHRIAQIKEVIQN